MSTAPLHDSTLTPAQLAERSGVAAGTLRVWGSRYGFPAGTRRPGGHHRYSEEDVEAVRIVQRLRARGLSMPAAIAQATATDQFAESSIFAGLRRHRPDLKPFVLTKRALLQLTHAIEDEHCARAGAGLLLGSFQHARHFRQSESRWQELARTVECVIALADFDKLTMPGRGPIEVPVARDHPLGREWTLIADSPSARSCLSAWELPSSQEQPDRQRRFEVIWSFDPGAVSHATAVARSLVGAISPDAAERIPDEPHPVPTPGDELRFASDLATRAYVYMAAELDRA